MTLEDLVRAGVTLPQAQWGKHRVRSTVNKPAFVAANVLAILSGALMYWGDGRWETWLGAALFLVSLFSTTGLCLHATETQGSGAARPRRRWARSACPDGADGGRSAE
jgi:hypothetical protein